MTTAAIALFGAPGTQIGGPTFAAGNLIVANLSAGIEVAGTGASAVTSNGQTVATTIQGNFIGTADPFSALQGKARLRDAFLDWLGTTQNTKVIAP